MDLIFAPSLAIAVASLAVAGSFVLSLTPSSSSKADYTALGGKSVDEDGTPIDAEAFWLSMRQRKVAIAATFALLLALRMGSLGWYAATPWIGGATSLHLFAEIGWSIAYATGLAMSAYSIPTRSVRKHWRHTLNLCALVLSIMVVDTARLLLAMLNHRPLAGDEANRVLGEQGMSIVAAIDLVLAFAVLLQVLTLPKSPRLHYKPRLLTGYRHTDESADDPVNVSPLAWCSPISHLLFNWASPLLDVGASKDQLDGDDIPYLKSSFRPSTIFPQAREKLERDVEGSWRPKWFNPLLWRLAVLNKRAFLLQLALASVVSFIYYLPPLALNRLVAFLEEREGTGKEQKSLVTGYAFVIFLLASLLLDAVIEGQLWYLSNAELCSRIRTQLNTLIFDKTLRRKDVSGSSASAPASDAASAVDVPGAAASAHPSASSAHLANGSTNLKAAKERAIPERETAEDDGSKPEIPTFSSRGQILNLFSVDVDRVSDFPNFSFSLEDCPLEIAIGTFFLYQLLGNAALIGIAVNIFFIPLNHWASKAFATTQDRLMSARDRRVTLTSEALQAIRMLKFMAWEKPFEDRILASRTEELKQQRINYLLEVAFNFLWTLSPVLSTLLAFWWYTSIQGHTLTPSKAFTSLAVFQELRFALNTLPDVLVSGIQSLVSLRRIQAYLDSPDIEIPPARDASYDESPGDAIVALRDATVTWPAVSHEDISSPYLGSSTPRRSFLLSDVSLTFPNGQLSLICGPLGSGKSLLLLTLLGEADVLAGQVVCPRSAPDAIAAYEDEEWAHSTERNWLTRSCAYVPQSAWLQNATVQDNILFGLPMLRNRYDDVLEACSLVKDLEILEDGDSTEIGERGVNLSGGQKARISLARAVYSRASYLFLDDVLSAVDAHTADHIFRKCFKGPLLESRTVLLVSHHVQLCLPGADYVVLLDNGNVRFTGDRDAFSDSPYLNTIVGGNEEDPADKPPRMTNGIPSKPVNKVLRSIRQQNGDVSESSSGASSEEESDSESESDDEDDRVPRKLVEDEARAVGHVDRRVWLHYTSANGAWAFWTIFVAAFIGTQLIEIGETWWLRIWSGSYDGPGRPSHGVNYYLVIYAIIAIANVTVETLRYGILYNGAIRASTRLYKQLLHSVLRAPLRMFDTVPLGRLLNRFAKDMEGIDSQLPDNIGRSTMYFLSIITTILTITAVAPLFLLFFALLSFFYVQRGKLYTQTARELRRLDSISKSPLFSLYSEAIGGVAVIRAFGASDRFMAYMLWRAEDNLSYFYHLWVANRWLSIRFSLLSTLVICATAAIMLQTRAPAAVAGFALTFALNITSDMLFLVRRFTALELSLIAVERVKEYAEIEQEAPEIVEPRPPAAWPYRGDVSVENLCIRYSEELPDVLHDVNFSAAGGSKIGIVGATGCGKSTLALSFFRFVEAHAGRIVVDGLDIANIGLQDLRSRLTIIPQDPTILSGTLRSALDVFNEHDDMELFDSLRRVHLLPPVDTPQAATATEDGENVNAFQNLDLEVNEQGSNFSQECGPSSAPDIAQPSAVVCLDEATSNVDYKTDELITQTIAQEFADATLLVIAHRLRTVISFDKILLLDAGRVIEFDKPSKLLDDPDSRFYQLCQATGKREFKILSRMAQGGSTPKRPIPRPRKTRRSSGFPTERKRTLSGDAAA